MLNRASLPLYALPEIRSATEALWQGIARHLMQLGLESVPTQLDQPKDVLYHWRRPDILFSQMCSEAFVRQTKLPTIIATPCYDAPGCDGPYVSSLIIVRQDHLAQSLPELYGSRCVVDRWQSASYGTLLSAVAPFHDEGRFFRDVQISGDHRASLARVGGGEADVCAIDAVLYELIYEYAPALLSQTRVLCRTPPLPAPPFITNDSQVQPLLLKALQVLLYDLELLDARATLLFQNIRPMNPSAYGVYLQREQQAIALGYPQLR